MSSSTPPRGAPPGGNTPPHKSSDRYKEKGKEVERGTRDNAKSMQMVRSPGPSFQERGMDDEEIYTFGSALLSREDRDILTRTRVNRLMATQTSFQPSHRVTPDISHIQKPGENRESDNYLGRRTFASNQFIGTDKDRSTSVFITKIPAEATLTDVLDALVGTGRIWASHYTPASGEFGTSMCKVVYTKYRPAEELILTGGKTSQGFWTGRGLWILGRRVFVQRNRHLFRENANPNESRVLMIKGPSSDVDVDVLRGFFDADFFSDTIRVISHPTGDQGIVLLEWQFGSCHAQAITAKMAIERHPSMKRVEVWYARDPCE